MTANDRPQRPADQGVGTPADSTPDRLVAEGPSSVRRSRFVLSDPENLAAEIIEASGARFGQLLAAELVALADEVGR